MSDHGGSKHGGHSTTTIARPKDTSGGRTRPVERTRDDTIFADLTRPIPADKQLVQGRGKRLVIWLGALVVVLSVVAAFFVLPVQSWLRQQDEIDRKREVADALEAENADMTREIDRLNTPEGVEEAAREVIGYVQRGEIRLTVLPGTEAPATMPSGWPYDTMAQILAVRTAEVAAPPTP